MDAPTNCFSRSTFCQCTSRLGFFVNINYLVLFSLAVALHRVCAAVNEMKHLQCFLVMTTPTSTPISSTPPTSSHLLRDSWNLLASAAPSRPKISAKKSCNHKLIQTTTKRETFCYWTMSWFLYIHIKRNTPLKISCTQKHLHLCTKMCECVSLKEFKYESGYLQDCNISDFVFRVSSAQVVCSNF